MTREDAKDLWSIADGSELDDVLVDKIFDSLDTELCINCVYGDEAYDNKGELIYCDELGLKLSKTFGCVYFQKKEKK